VLFAVCAALIGIAAAFGYAAVPLRSQEAGYESNLDALRVTAARSLQGYVTQQVQAGARLFAIARQVSRLPPGPPRPRRWPVACPPSRAV